ncbi:MAG: UDP-N-acetylglucosamine:LPS N-acetylglucosamine transferase [Gammaproteobacteria bacterium]|jgi:UDP-N-acetylglucosamine--N-acetylmuramyl-(pentapeptide) pyrophosphoryl-undecaprenol N-acetylglucosamine transferase|nr:UDP-N-acetylglucosamine:LPS N-acetylglucosamine transferase [Gammaproteobacteria bacterium]
MNKNTILIIAGGTGGHIMPALSVAALLEEQSWSIQWLGTRKGLEAVIVPKHGFMLHFIEISGLRGKGIMTKLLAPFRIIQATYQSLRIISALKPKVVLGMGGFVTGPGCLAAWLMRVPVVIHEQNAIAGLTNRCLGFIARSVCSGFPVVFPARWHPVVTGNPVRQDIAAVSEPDNRYSQHIGAIRILVIGGSLGAKIFNETIPAALSILRENERPLVWHQTGKSHLETTAATYHRFSLKARIEPFIENMQEAYEWADIVICRAGASTIAELSSVGIAALLIPYPYAVDDHQYVNGMFLVNAGAATLWREKEFSAEHLKSWLQTIGTSRDKLLVMARAGRSKAIPDAALALANQCIYHARESTQRKQK